MSILIQTGYRTTNSEAIMQELYKRGLTQPLNSISFNMSPQQITDKLYSVISRKDCSVGSSKLAENLIVDLLLANLDSEHWGWESENNLYISQYLRLREPDARFILIFDDPIELITNHINMSSTAEVIDLAINSWIDYHNSMIRFYEENSDVAILVEGKTALNNFNKFSEKIQNVAQKLHFDSSFNVTDKSNAADEISTDLDLRLDNIKQYLVYKVIHFFPEAIKIYNILLEKATIKNNDSIYGSREIDLNYFLKFIKDLATKEKEEESYIARISKLQNENKRLNGKLENTIHKQKVIDNELKTILKIERNEMDMKINDKSLNNETLDKNTSILNLQIKQLQSELERYYIENEILKNGKEPNNHKFIKSDINSTKNYYGAAERVKNDLPYRLGSRIVGAKKPRQVVSLPLVLINEYRIFTKTKANIEKLPPIEQYKDVNKADKVKKQLSFKLGKVLVDSFSRPSSMVRLPISITKEVLNYKKNKDK